MINLQPDEAAMVRRVFHEIAGQPWFNRNAITERELLKLILKAHSARPLDDAQVAELHREARARFSILR